MDNINDRGKILITGHILIRDTESKEVLVNKSQGIANVATSGKYYVYLWLNPLKNNQPFYVGKGSDDRAVKHLQEHQKETIETAKNKRKFSTIQKIYANGLEPKNKYYVENIDEELAYNIETKLILIYGRKGIDKDGILDNIMLEHFHPPGGKKGMTHKEKRNPEHTKKLYESRKKNGTLLPTKETRQLWSRQRRGRKANLETKSLMSKQKLGEKNHNALEWEITDPNNIKHNINGLRKWCRDNNVSFYDVYNSRNRWKTVRYGKGKNSGWSKKGYTK